MRCLASGTEPTSIEDLREISQLVYQTLQVFQIDTITSYEEILRSSDIWPHTQSRNGNEQERVLLVQK